MTVDLPTPPLPELARASGETVEELSSWFISYFDSHPAPFNYRLGTRIVRAAYKGLHNIDSLVAGCAAEKLDVGRKSNSEVVRLAAPLAFGRSTRVFDLSPRKFNFGRDKSSSYRVPFFFVENGVIKLYFLQPRKSFVPSFDELGMIATVMKKYLLDVEFFGHRVDVEFVTLEPQSAELSGVPAKRVARRFSLEALSLWSGERLARRLSLISAALDAASRSGRISRKRILRHVSDPEMPLFD